ncbi:glycosyl hydrolase family 16 [Hypnocyclicus thermotrophus]|uniref:Glycosyl hydrolase family 16 n=1 Tax=Hypnocyclicus thermotrophus TaxID=1627895 RepID=A0AA46I605_9FUSO|nr:glycoside hydrolase family 16 protein [Hypnocyclicus thermotrophus]TDT70460.1 glycosyl hydrolase family 16 [Hypnocyclicus thermotrophus]
MKKYLVFIILILFIGCNRGFNKTNGGIKIIDNSDKKEVVWEENFNGDKIDENIWTFEVGNGNNGWGNAELEYYTKENSELRDGKLIITAKKENKNGYQYTSSRLKTQGKFSFTYGTVEVKAKLPKGKGIWPAIWMLGENISTKGWPDCGEIDIMELLGDNPSKIYGTIHGPGYSGANGKSSNYTLSSGDFSDDFHIFKVEWDITSIKWYVDNEMYHEEKRSNISNWVFDDDFFIILNVAVGGNWPESPDINTTFPQIMEIDYIKVITYE